jgi:hypothetical protein
LREGLWFLDVPVIDETPSLQRVQDDIMTFALHMTVFGSNIDSANTWKHKSE